MQKILLIILFSLFFFNISHSQTLIGKTESEIRSYCIRNGLTESETSTSKILNFSIPNTFTIWNFTINKYGYCELFLLVLPGTSFKDVYKNLSDYCGSPIKVNHSFDNGFSYDFYHNLEWYSISPPKSDEEIFILMGKLNEKFK